LWGWDNGSDGRGDNLPPEELDLIVEGNHYGWPSCYGKRVQDPITAQDPTITPMDCSLTTAPVRTYTAHCAPITFLFYTHTNFPALYRNNGFISFHGSWNRLHPKGYKVAEVVFDRRGRPVGFRDFVTGWLIENDTAFFGRPAGLVVAQDGALLITDDNNGAIYRVTSTSKRKR